MWVQCGPFRLILSHLEQIGPLWTNLDILGAIESHLKPFGVNWSHFGAIWRHLESFKVILSYFKGFNKCYFELFEAIWSYLEFCDDIIRCCELFRAILSYLKLFQVIWSYLEPLGTSEVIWSHLTSYGAIKCYLEHLSPS